MKVVVQRVSRAEVRVDGRVVSAIGRGLLVLVGVGRGDGEPQARWTASKLAGLRVFEDADGRMNRSVVDAGGQILVVSQFTLLGDCRRGRRPSFVDAARPGDAEPIVDLVAGLLRESGVPVLQGEFGARMEVDLVNDGPVTLVIEAP